MIVYHACMNYDVIIIGGGIIGLSVAKQLLAEYPDFKVAVLEKEAKPSVHQTGHNSGVIHAGVYYTPGSLKAKFCLQGNRESKAFCREHNIPFQEPGKLIVATNDLELTRMQKLIERCELNGLEFEVLNQAETLRAQPGIRAIGSILVKASGIVNWQTVAQKYAELFGQRGGVSFFNQTLVDIEEKASSITLKTACGKRYECAYLISCAGLHADRIVKMAKLVPNFKIIPFRGEYYRLDDRYSNTFKHLIYPVPDPNLPFLGVHFTPQIAGYTTVGPNAVLALAREGYRWSNINLKDAWETLSFLGTWKVILKNPGASLAELSSSLSKNYYLRRVQAYFPSLKKADLLAYPAGVRAQAVDQQGKFVDDFLFKQTLRTLHTCNAPSPAATSSLPIGSYIVEQFTAMLK